MSDREPASAAAKAGEPPAPEPAEATEAPNLPSSFERARASGWGAAGVALAALLLVVALVATAPLWAPWLSWGATDNAAQRALAARVERVEAAQAQQQPQQRQELQQLRQMAAETKTTVQRLGERLEALEARPAAPIAGGNPEELREQLGKLARSASDLTARIDGLEKGVREQVTRDTGDAALILGLLQIRSAVQAGRPFAAEYEAFAALARRRPEIAEAAAPLVEPAKSGVASPTVLAKRLRELAGSIAGVGASAPASDPAASGWGDAALARLRGLVTIRRIDGARPEGADAAVNVAELALAGGDLPAAVAALDKLTGAPAEAAAPWLRMARQRLAVDAALRRLEALVTARLGSPASAPGSSG